MVKDDRPPSPHLLQRIEYTNQVAADASVIASFASGRIEACAVVSSLCVPAHVDSDTPLEPAQRSTAGSVDDDTMVTELNYVLGSDEPAPATEAS